MVMVMVMMMCMVMEIIIISLLRTQMVQSIVVQELSVKKHTIVRLATSGYTYS